MNPPAVKIIRTITAAEISIIVLIVLELPVTWRVAEVEVPFGTGNVPGGGLVIPDVVVDAAVTGVIPDPGGSGGGGGGVAAVVDAAVTGVVPDPDGGGGLGPCVGGGKEATRMYKLCLSVAHFRVPSP